MSFASKMAKKKADRQGKKDNLKPDISVSSLLSEEPINIPEGEMVVRLDPSEITNKKQVRKKFSPEYIKELANGLQSQGQDHPIIVTPKNSDGLYVIQKGECRWRAAKLAGIKLDAVVREPERDPEKVILGELSENVHRDNLDPLEIAQAFSDLIKLGMTAKDIAEQLGKSKSYVSRHLKIVELPECISVLCEKSIVRDTDTLANLKSLYEVNKDRAVIICESAITDGITRSKSAQYLKEAKQGVETNTQAQPPKIAEAAEAPKTDETIVDPRSGNGRAV